MSATSPFSSPVPWPIFPEVVLYNIAGGQVRPWEFGGWQRESLSWKQHCYIHAGLSGPGQSIFQGPDVLEFFSGIAGNSFKKFPIGTAKHAVMCNEAGLIASHGVLQRKAEDQVQLFVSGPWAGYKCSRTRLRVEERPLDNYLFQIAGPTSLQTLERASGESLRDIKFLHFRNCAIAGKEVEILRAGMAGTLAYELHGPAKDGAEVYNAVVEAGRDYGIERLGWRTYTVNHVEGGFPQNIWTFNSAADEDPDFRAFMQDRFGGLWPIQLSGSVDPSNMRARYRTPTEVGWQGTIRLDHDFIGREALQREFANPRRTIATLVWNSEDVIDIYASLFRPGEPYKVFELPTSPHLRGILGHADHILKDGKEVGFSSGTTYSYYYRQTISHAVLDIEHVQVGTEVVVQWGDFGGKIKHVRARVERYPYLNEQRNQDVDLTTIATGIK